MEQLSRAYLAQQGCAELNWRILLTAAEIHAGVRQLAERINALYAPPQAKPLVLVGILKGVFVFLADLSRHLRVPYSVYFLEASSYAGQERGEVQFATSLAPSKLRGRQVLLLDELFDHGATMAAMKRALLSDAELGLAEADIRTCTLFIKESGTRLPRPELVGLPCLPALWLVGYGLDDNGEKRGWTHLFACPKAAGVPRVAEDAIFDDAAAYRQLRSRLEAELGAAPAASEAAKFSALVQFAESIGVDKVAMGSAAARELAPALCKLFPDWAARIDHSTDHVFFE